MTRVDPRRAGRLPSRRRRTISAVTAAWLVCCLAWSANALELWSEDDSVRRADLRSTLKLTGFASHNPEDPWLYPDRTNTTGLLRTRFGVNMVLSDRVTAELAYEHHRRAAHGGGLSFAGNPSFPPSVRRPGGWLRWTGRLCATGRLLNTAMRSTARW